MITSFRGPYSFLSNFHLHEQPGPWEMTYPSAEHAFQACKAMDRASAQLIHDAPTSTEAKRRGRQVKVRPDWDDVRVNLMRLVVHAKFADPQLRALLSKTAPAPLVEGNTWGDVFWGQVFVQGRWVGENHLGRILMEVRGGKM